MSGGGWKEGGDAHPGGGGGEHHPWVPHSRLWARLLLPTVAARAAARPLPPRTLTLPVRPVRSAHVGDRAAGDSPTGGGTPVWCVRSTRNIFVLSTDRALLPLAARHGPPSRPVRIDDGKQPPRTESKCSVHGSNALPLPQPPTLPPYFPARTHPLPHPPSSPRPTSLC